MEYERLLLDLVGTVALELAPNFGVDCPADDDAVHAECFERLAAQVQPLRCLALLCPRLDLLALSRGGVAQLLLYCHQMQY